MTTNAFSPGFIGRVAERRRGVHVCLGVSHLRHLVALRLSQSELLTLSSPEWTVTEHLCNAHRIPSVKITLCINLRTLLATGISFQI